MLPTSLPDNLNFTPALRPIYNNGVPVDPSMGQFVVNQKTGEPLSIVGGRYIPTPYALLYENMIDGLQSSDLDLSDATAKFTSINNGSAMSALITLPKYNFKHIIGEPTAVAIRMDNSVDGTVKYNVRASVLRLFCLNLQSSMAENISYTAMNTANADPAQIGKVASQWPHALERDAHLFKHMTNIPISRETAQVFLEKYLCVRKTRTKIKVNEKWLNSMMSLYDGYQNSLGQTAYSLYNTLTHYGTHVDKDSLRGADLGTRALRQERQVQRLVRSSVWKNLIRHDEFEQQLVA